MRSKVLRIFNGQMIKVVEIQKARHTVIVCTTICSLLGQMK